jgi:proteic killer suppression protein
VKDPLHSLSVAVLYGRVDVEFADSELHRLETDPHFGGNLPDGAVRGFRKAMQSIRAALDERDLYALKGLHFEKLKGDRSHQRSIRINKQWRLILEIVDGDKKNRIRVIGIEDYH